MPDEETPAAALVKSLREQIVERMRGQHQVVVLATAVAGAVLSLGWEDLGERPEALALLSLLFAGLSLATLRHDQEITIIAEHLLDMNAFGDHAGAQQAWEQHKLRSMQGSGIVALVSSASQSVGIYGVPVIGTLVFAGAAAANSPSAITWAVLGVTCLFFALLVIGGLDTARRYRRLGEKVSKSKRSRLGATRLSE